MAKRASYQENKRRYGYYQDIIKGFSSKLDEDGGEESVATLVCGICV